MINDNFSKYNFFHKSFLFLLSSPGKKQLQDLKRGEGGSGNPNTSDTLVTGMDQGTPGGDSDGAGDGGETKVHLGPNLKYNREI